MHVELVASMLHKTVCTLKLAHMHTVVCLCNLAIMSCYVQYHDYYT